MQLTQHVAADSAGTAISRDTPAGQSMDDNMQFPIIIIVVVVVVSLIVVIVIIILIFVYRKRSQYYYVSWLMPTYLQLIIPVNNLSK